MDNPIDGAAKGIFGMPRPLVMENTIILLVLPGTTIMSNELERVMGNVVSTQEFIEVERVTSTTDEGKEIVYVEISEDAVTLSELKQIESDAEATLTQSDLPFTELLEIEVRCDS